MSLQGEDAAKVLQQIEHINQDSFDGDDFSRMRALERARALCSRLETPWDSLVRMIWLEVRLTWA